MKSWQAMGTGAICALAGVMVGRLLNRNPKPPARITESSPKRDASPCEHKREIRYIVNGNGTRYIEDEYPS